MSKKISQLNEAISIDGSEVIPISKPGFSLKLTLNRLKSIFTKADVGLGNVDNTSDIDKPLSSASIDAINTKADRNHSHNVSDIATLQQTLDNKANISHNHTVDNVSGLQTVLDTKSNTGHIHGISDVTGLVQSLSNKSDISHSHSLTKSDVGLPSVDNTSDVNKPLSTAQKAYVDNAIAGINVSTGPHTHEISEVNGLQSTLDGKSNTGHSHNVSEINGIESYVDSRISVRLGTVNW